MYGAKFWICDQKGVDNTPVSLLLLNSVHTVSRPSPFLSLPHPGEEASMPKRLGGNAARTADQGDITYRGNTIMLCYNLVVVCHKVPGTGYQCSATVWTLVGWW